MAEGIEQPVRAGDYVATVWQVVRDGGAKPCGRDLGRLLRALHDLPQPSFAQWHGSVTLTPGSPTAPIWPSS